MNALQKAIDGYKTYLLLIGLGILVAVNHGDGNLDLGQLISDPELLFKEVLVALGGSARSTFEKLIKK